MTGRLSFRGAKRRGICFSLALEADHPIWSRALLARSCSSHQSRSSHLESRAARALLLLSPEQIIPFGVARCWRAPAPSHQSRSSHLESRAARALLLLSPEQIIAFGVARCSRAPAPLSRSTLRSELADNYGLWIDNR